ncbi:MAG: undecaprenyl-diphosphate phosphatase [Candidatus Altiarchaeota archaeon]|nr:undecaprenyl-diphosphate phosphatase [Candidatus Altiarchaeota archaeon]
MELVHAVVLGAIQGMFEWLPISSQGNLTLFMVGILGTSIEDAVNLSLWLHIGTLLSVLVYFRRDLISLKLQEWKWLLRATFFSFLVGGPLYIFVRSFPIQSGARVIAFIGILLIITGITQLKVKERGNRHQDTKSSVVTGILQGFSALPGISRSGTTTSALMLQGFSGEESLRLSFLLSVPLVFGVEIVLAIINPSVITQNSLIGAGVAFVVGLLSIDLFLRLAKKIKFAYFAIILGLLSFIPLFV